MTTTAARAAIRVALAALIVWIAVTYGPTATLATLIGAAR
jgi:hypothetical protein